LSARDTGGRDDQSTAYREDESALHGHASG